MNRSRGGVILILVVLVSFAGMPPAGAVASGGPFGLQASLDADQVNMNVEVAQNGTAVWEIAYLIRLQTENDTAAFESLQADISNNTSAYLGRFATRINATVSEAESSTGRSMTAHDFAVATDVRPLGNQYGVVSYTFTWDGFATVDGEALRMGDAVEGLFLDQQTTLRITYPDTDDLNSVHPDPTVRREHTVVWRGPLDFGAGEPSLVVAPGGSNGGSEPTGEGTLPWSWLLGGVLVVLIGAGVWYRRRSGSIQGPSESTSSTEGSPPTELMSNEERVLDYLETHAGRAKQQEIVDGLDWTEAKTSQVLSDMQENGQIEKFRIGRENVVKLPETPDESE